MIHIFSRDGKAKVSEAIKTATKAHAHQNRKSTDIPYIFHPLETAMELAYEGYGSDLIIAALLHDTLEDTALTKKMIKLKFGKKVLDIVIGASEIEVAGRGSDTWQQRKEHTLNYLSDHASHDVLLVSCADKLSNIRSIQRDYHKVGHTIWERFNQPYEKQKWYYTELVNSMSRLKNEKIYQEFSSIVRKVFD